MDLRLRRIPAWLSITLACLLVFGSACQPAPAVSDNPWAAAFARADERGEFRVAYLGASVTCGQGASDVWTTSYPALLNAWLEKRFGQVVFTNYCLGSATSLTGLVQFKQEMLEVLPDLVLAEFGILDRSDEEPALPANEAMIRSSHAHGIPFLMVAVATSDTETTSRAQLVELARHYGLPIADMQALMDRMDLSWPDVSGEGDRWHPNDRGHALLAESITTVLDDVLAGNRTIPAELAEPLSATDYASARLIAAGEGAYPDDLFEPIPSEAMRMSGQALSLVESYEAGELRFRFDGSVLGVLFLHDAVPGTFTYRVDGGAFETVSPPIWQKDHVLRVDLSPGPHEVLFRLERGPMPVGIEGILVVPGS